MNIYFMRHGETDWNRERRIQGSTDIPLNQNGINLAQKVSRRIHENGIYFDLIFTSQLIRARKTAEIMNQFSHSEIIVDTRIKEFLFGQAEGATYDDLRNDPKFGSLKNWFLDPQNYHAELGAESYEQFFGRIHSFLEEQIKPRESSCSDVLIVCHGGVVRGLLKVMLGWSVQRFAETKIPNCGLNLVELKNGDYNLIYTAREFN